MSDSTFTYDARLAHRLLQAGKITVPSITDERPAGDIVELLDVLIAPAAAQLGAGLANLRVGAALVAPDGFCLNVINDDELDITGLIVNVTAVGRNWPAASDGWSEIDNYLSHGHEDDTPEQLLDELVDSILGRANRCLAFLQAYARLLDGPPKVTTILCIRDPDYTNEYVSDGPISNVTIDIGGEWRDYKHFASSLSEGDAEAVQYETYVLGEVADLAPDNPVRQAAEAFFTVARKDGA